MAADDRHVVDTLGGSVRVVVIHERLLLKTAVAVTSTGQYRNVRHRRPTFFVQR
jgi:hypothetical protein